MVLTLFALILSMSKAQLEKQETGAISKVSFRIWEMHENTLNKVLWTKFLTIIIIIKNKHKIKYQLYTIYVKSFRDYVIRLLLFYFPTRLAVNPNHVYGIRYSMSQSRNVLFGTNQFSVITIVTVTYVVEWINRYK